MSPKETLAAKIRALLATVNQDNIAAARLVAESKKMFTSSLAWTTWAKEQVGLCRRTCFLYARVSDFFAKNPDFVHQGCTVWDFAKVEILDSLGDQLSQFMATHDAEELTREELRNAVAAFLGKPRPAAAPVAGKPAQPQQLLLLLRDAETLASADIGTVVEIVEAGFDVAKTKLATQDDRLALAATLRAMADEIDPPKVVTP